jgi:hypothetical protein
MEARADQRIAEIIAAQAEFVEIRIVGEFDAPDWVVTPSGVESQS